jgi:hypothetical protein
MAASHRKQSKYVHRKGKSTIGKLQALRLSYNLVVRLPDKQVDVAGL